MKLTRWLLTAALVACAPLAQAQSNDVYLLQVSPSALTLADPSQIEDMGDYKQGTYISILSETNASGVDFLQLRIQHDCSRRFANKIVRLVGYNLEDESDRPRAQGSGDTDWVISDANSTAGSAWSLACEPASSKATPYPKGYRGLEATTREFRGFIKQQEGK